MTFIARLLSKGKPPRPRVRICVECGMPVDEHKEWCSIFRTLQERAAALAAK